MTCLQDRKQEAGPRLEPEDMIYQIIPIVAVEWKKDIKRKIGKRMC